MYQTILFDLDGTLTNSELGITNSVAYALGKYGIQVPDKKALRVFIGPPLQESFERFYGFSKEECLKAIDYYHEYFSEKGLYENEVYLGVPDLLASLKQAGKQLIVATSKPEEFSIQILKHFGLYDYFDFVAGATMDRKRSKKSDVIQYALEQNGITDLAHTIMIGETGSTMCLALKRKSLILSVSFMALEAGKNWKKPAPPILLKKLAKLQLL